MRSTQLAVRRVFKFSPESVFLVVGDGSVELPDEDGRFQVDTMDASLVWTCEGDSCKPGLGLRRLVAAGYQLRG